jgi:hypothetical protein
MLSVCLLPQALVVPERSWQWAGSARQKRINRKYQVLQSSATSVQVAEWQVAHEESVVLELPWMCAALAVNKIASRGCPNQGAKLGIVP